MSPTLVALIWLPCVSALHQSALSNETVAMSCPDTVKYVYNQPAAPAPEPVVARQEPKPVTAKKAAPHKRKYHRKRRRK
jgi:hypothetical protein